MARDIFHQNVKEALIKDGWTITHDPYELEIGSPDYEIDLGAEKIIAAQRGVDIIAVEVKSFVGRSIGYEFHQAVGQYRNYKSALNDLDPNRLIFLAISQDVYESFFKLPFPQKRIKEDQIQLLVFSPDDNSIVIWIKQ
jgi:XisH protein